MTGRSLLPVYLIHWNAPEWCGDAVRSLQASAGVELDVTVVDNGQQHGPALAECLPVGTRVLETGHNAGYTGAANLALRDWRSCHPDADLVVVGSHDLHVEPDTLARLVAAADAHPDAGIVAPLLTAPNRRAGGIWTGTHSRQVGLPAGEQGVVQRDWASGTCLLLRRACVDDLGEFDERLGSYMEDVDYGLRARAHGWTVLVQTAARAHGRGTASDAAIEAVAHNTVLIAAKRHGVLGAARSVGLFGFWALRGLVAGVVPGRSAAKREVSRRDARQRASGVCKAMADGALWRALRDRSGRVRRSALS